MSRRRQTSCIEDSGVQSKYWVMSRNLHCTVLYRPLQKIIPGCPWHFLILKTSGNFIFGPVLHTRISGNIRSYIRDADRGSGTGPFKFFAIGLIIWNEILVCVVLHYCACRLFTVQADNAFPIAAGDKILKQINKLHTTPFLWVCELLIEGRWQQKLYI